MAKSKGKDADKRSKSAKSDKSGKKSAGKDAKSSKKKRDLQRPKGEPKVSKKKAQEIAKGKAEPQIVPAQIDKGQRSAGPAPLVYDTPVDAPKVDKDLRPERPLSEVLRVEKGFKIAEFDPAATPGFDEGRKKGEEALAAYAPEIGEWQERLWAESKGGGTRSLLLVLQGLDSAGKGGIVRHVMSHADPAGIKATAFKAPTEEEKKHDFLWRVRNALPAPGQIGVFDRSHYEDVLIVRALGLVPRTTIGRRYAQINAFEREVIAGGTQVLKVFLYISKDEQKARLMERLDRPDKRFKYTPGDTGNRAHWDAYLEAFQVMFDRTSTVGAPWHVIPANNKWYARYAVQQLLLEKLRDMSPDWPVPDYDVETEKERLAQS